jgi:hypothetical protein
MSFFKKLLGGKEDREDSKEGTGAPRQKPSSPEDKTVDPAISGTRDSTRMALSAKAFGERAERRRNYGKTTTHLRSSILFEGLLGQDPKLQESLPAIRDPLKKMLIDLLMTARVATRRIGSDEIFYQKFDELKNGLASNGLTNRNIILLAFSTWLMGKEFEFNPAGRVPATSACPVQLWNVTRCNARELAELKPQIDAYLNDKITNRKFLLADVFYGLKI